MWTIHEGIWANSCDTITCAHGRKLCTSVECIVANGGNAIRQINAFQFNAFVKTVLTNNWTTIRHSYVCKVLATIKHFFSHRCDTCSYGNCCERWASYERFRRAKRIAKFCHIVRNVNLCQFVAAVEGAVSDCGDIAADVHSCQVNTVLESLIGNGRNIVGLTFVFYLGRNGDRAGIAVTACDTHSTGRCCGSCLGNVVINSIHREIIGPCDSCCHK